MRCPICNEEVRGDEKAERWGPEFAHANCVTAHNTGKATERDRIIAWLDSYWPDDVGEERYHRAEVAAKLRLE